MRCLIGIRMISSSNQLVGRVQPAKAVPPIAAACPWIILLQLVACAPAWTPPAEPSESSCAWYGDADGKTLYFGQSAFWSAFRASGGDPTADLRVTGPRRIGRFDLIRRRALPPIELGRSPSGTWDVLIHPQGRVFFTTFFDAAGAVDPRTSRVEIFREAGVGLNELALGPDGSVLATRYGGAGGADGTIAWLDATGGLLRDLPVSPVPGFVVAPKSLAFDAARRLIWFNTDLVPTDARDPFSPGVAHDARAIDLEGRERFRFADPEVQFVTFGADGTGYFAEASSHRLWLRILPPGSGPIDPGTGQTIGLDEAFPRAVDFVQDARVDAVGRVVLTRWSGRVHVVAPPDRVASIDLPRPDPGGLYYTAVLADGGVCATSCAAVEVVCADAPAAALR